MIVITDPDCTQYEAPGHPERPQRISRTAALLLKQTALAVTWEKPAPVREQQVLRAHEPELVQAVEEARDFDGDTPSHPHIARHARRSVGGALRALAVARTGAQAFSLLRPPGHHATPTRAMGFCYFNSIAIAVLEALATGARRVAVFDFDVHHGNGTEEILCGRSDCAFFSVHQHPAFPGTGVENYANASNYPVAPGAARAVYRATLERALEDLRRYEPDLIAVSAGFDAYRLDPLSQASLEGEDFFWLGRSLRRLDRPLFSVLEGGYSQDLPTLILEYLQGLMHP